MKNIIVVLVVFAVLIHVSVCNSKLLVDSATTTDASPDERGIEVEGMVCEARFDAGQKDKEAVCNPSSDNGEETEEVVDEVLPYQPIIDDRRPFTAEELAIPDSAGTITCSGIGPTMRVEIKGNLLIGLTSLLPLKMMRRVSLTKEGRACWGGSLWSGCVLTQPICTKEKGREMQCQSPIDMHVVFTNVPRASYVPQIGGYGVFDLKQWKIVGCIREGCDDVCRPGEKCRSGQSCTLNGK